MPQKAQATKAKRVRPEEGPVVLSMKVRPKKHTKHLYHKCEDGSGLVDLGLIVKHDLPWPAVGKGKIGRKEYTTVENGRIWDITVYDPSVVVGKYPPRKK